MTKRKGWTIGKTRRVLYGSAKVLGDVNAIKRGRIVRRLWNRALGRLTGRALGRARR